MEAIESYHAGHITLPLKLATYQQLCFTHRLAGVAPLPRYALGGFHEHLRGRARSGVSALSLRLLESARAGLGEWAWRGPG